MRPYFHRVMEQTPTRFWINNPSRDEAVQAIDNGALGCTTNPSYPQKMVDHPQEADYAAGLLDEAICESNDDHEAEAILQRRLVQPIARTFMPTFNISGGRHGYVSIQGDPLQEHDPSAIIQDALRNRNLGVNIACKVPVTEAGLEAMAVLFEQDIPVNATEIMSIQQALDVFALYQRVGRRSDKHPRLFISQIAGIFDDYLLSVVEREGIDLSPDVLCQAGLAIGRKLYEIMQERQYPGTFVSGGARGLHHFTEMVGGEVCVTINWKGTADRLLEQNPPVVYRLFNPVPEKVIEELQEKLPDFCRAYLEGGLAPAEYEEFGPVQHFRNSFIKSWQRVLALIQARRVSQT